jgi:hypothetical protein
MSLLRSLVLVRAGRRADGYAELDRLRRVPSAYPSDEYFGDISPALVLMGQDERFRMWLED